MRCFPTRPQTMRVVWPPLATCGGDKRSHGAYGPMVYPDFSIEISGLCGTVGGVWNAKCIKTQETPGPDQGFLLDARATMNE